MEITFVDGRFSFGGRCSASRRLQVPTPGTQKATENRLPFVSLGGVDIPFPSPPFMPPQGRHFYCCASAKQQAALHSAGDAVVKGRGFYGGPNQFRATPAVLRVCHPEGAACGDREGLISVVKLSLVQTIRNSVYCRSARSRRSSFGLTPVYKCLPHPTLPRGGLRRHVTPLPNPFRATPVVLRVRHAEEVPLGTDVGISFPSSIFGLFKAGGPQLRLAKTRSFRVPMGRVVRAIRKLLPASAGFRIDSGNETLTSDVPTSSG